MSWDRFHFICRKAHAYIQSGESLQNAFSKAESYAGSDHYGKTIKPGSLSDQILHHIKKHNDSEAHALIALYGQMDLGKVLTAPSKLVMLTAYLTFLTLVFAGMSLIYQTFVAPRFLDFFEVVDIPPPESLMWYINNWWAITLVIFFLVIVSILINLELKSIFSLSASSLSPVFRFLIPKKIQHSYLNAIELMTFPIQSSQLQADIRRSALSEHLKETKACGQDIQTEINVLLRREGHTLSSLSQRYIQIWLAVIFIVVILSSFFFISSAYAPLFILGEAI